MNDDQINALAQYITSMLINLNMRHSAKKRIRKYIREIITGLQTAHNLFNEIEEVDLNRASFVFYPSQEPDLHLLPGFEPGAVNRELLDEYIQGYHANHIVDHYYEEDFAIS